MLFMVCIAPILAGCFFRFGIPLIERFLVDRLNLVLSLNNYGVLFDLLLSTITPYMFCFASSMVMLTEYDENITEYLAVTPIGKKGYLLTRLGIPAVLSFLASCALLLIFSVSHLPVYLVIVVSFLSGLLGIEISLLLFSVSNNRVEGMAMAKLSGLLLIGLPVPFFLPGKYHLFFTPLPSFWIARLAIERNVSIFFPGFIVSSLWILLLYKKFDRKISG
jgi:fluoroquinolone transport system permease protein